GPEAINAIRAGQNASTGNPWLVLATVAVAGVLLVMMTITFMTQYVVFQKTEAGAAASSHPLNPAASAFQSSSAQPAAQTASNGADWSLRVGVTGRFVLDQKTGQRFLNVPAVAQYVDSGDLAFFSKINASSTLYGTVMLKERVGVWYMMMKQNSVSALEPGILHTGKQPRLALRVAFSDGISSQPNTAILTFNSEAERTAMMGQLRQGLTSTFHATAPASAQPMAGTA
ncbi:MAG: hypothetical protein JOZ57_08880, partial [Abitibacteriaceae bacterium]|nr:hypothetical protein [Abditibacteriaceae bacterium]